MIGGGLSAARRRLVLTVVLALAVCVAVPAFGGAAAAQETSDADESISANDLEGQVFFGQTVTVSGLEPGVAQLLGVDDDGTPHVQTLEVDDSGETTIDTSTLLTEDYDQFVVRDANGNDHGPFEGTPQAVQFEFADGEVRNGDGAELVWTTDKRRQPVDLLVDANGDIDAETLDDAVGGDAFETTIHDDGTVRVHDVEYGDAVPVATRGLDESTYFFEIEVADTGSSDEARLSVQSTDDPDETVQLDDVAGQVFFGQTVEITGLSSSDEAAQLRRGDTENSSHVRNYVVDDAGVITVDTSSLKSGQYVIRKESGDDVGPFEVTAQEVEFEFADAQVADGDRTELVWQGDNRARTVDLLVDANGDIDAETLDDAVGGDAFETTVHDDSTIRVHDVQRGDEVPFVPDPVYESTYDVHESTYDFRVQVADTGASDDARLSVQSYYAPGVQFDEDIVTDHVGDVVEFTVETSQEVWLTVTDENGALEATVQLTEIDGDRPVTVRWNTHHALDENETLGFTADGATVNVASVEGAAVDESHLPNAEAGWTFDIDAYSSEAAVADGDFEDIMLVDLRQRQTGELTTYTAPGVNEYRPSSDLESILADATERDTVADGDLLIVEIEASGVFGYLNTDPEAFASEGLGFELRGQGGVFGAAPSANVSELEGAASIVERPEEDRIYVVIDSSEIPDINDGEEWDAEFSVDGAENPYVDVGTEEVASDPFTYEHRVVELAGPFDGDRLVLDAAEQSQVVVETNVAPGTDATLRINMQREYRTASGEIGEDGRYTFTPDLSGFESGAVARTVRVRAPNSGTQQSVEGVVGYDTSTFATEVDAPDSANASEDAQLDVSVTNVGTGHGTAVINVRIGDDEEVFLDTVSLDVGEQWTDSFDVPTDGAGSVEWAVLTQDQTRRGEVSVAGDGDYGGNQPQPYEGSDLYWDVTGDGSVTNADVTTFFAHQHTSPWNDRPDRFDFDGDGDVGQGDVIALFEAVTAGDSSVFV